MGHYTSCHATCNGQNQTCNGEPCDSDPADCGDFTNPEVQTCTGGGIPTQFGCGGPTPTQFHCTGHWCTETEDVELCDGDPESGGSSG